jgi:hypothetical protein
MIDQQLSFVEGLDTLSPSTSISANGYEWLINGRTRYGRVQPIKKHVELDNLPAGDKQGITAIGDVLIAFINGLAYYKKYATTVWIQIPNFVMSPNVDRIYSQAVPASTLNIQRKTDQNNANAPIIKSANVKVAGTPSGLIVQDGVNQPWIIFYQNGAFDARETKRYGAWKNTSSTNNDREYVPIGTQMMFLNSILFILAPDRKSIYRSVTGRPLDFVINVDANGNKALTEAEGGAKALSFAFDFDDITCISPLNIPDSFVYATKYQTRIITCDYNTTIFGEPLFRESARIANGIVSDESFIEIIGDYTFVDKESLVSFNASQQLNAEAKNSIFSMPISAFFNEVVQSNTKCIRHDDYALFSVRTIWGYAIMVYDIMRNVWVSVDITEVSQVKQFAKVQLDNEIRLYALTESGKLFHMFASDTEKYICQIKTKGFTPEKTTTEHKTDFFKPLFTGGNTDGTATVIEYVDEQRSSVGIVEHDLPSNLGGVPYPVIPPVGPCNTQRADTPGFVFKNSLTGKIISFIIQWDNDSELERIMFSSTEYESQASLKQKQSIHYGT